MSCHFDSRQMPTNGHPHLIKHQVFADSGWSNCKWNDLPSSVQCARTHQAPACWLSPNGDANMLRIHCCHLACNMLHMADSIGVTFPLSTHFLNLHSPRQYCTLTIQRHTPVHRQNRFKFIISIEKVDKK